MFLTRVITVAVLLPFLIGGMFFLPAAWWGILLLPPLLAAAWEWSLLSDFVRPARWGFCALVLVSALVMLPGLPVERLAFEQAVYGLSVVFWLTCVPAWLRFGWQVRHPLLLMLSGWLLLVPAWLALVRLQQWPWALLAVLGVIWVADSAAYFAGRTWGRHKLAVSISPGKTWEGVAGAAVAVAVYHALVWHFGMAGMHSGGAVAAAVLVAFLLPLSILGDLFESWIKRQAGVKDSGRLLPGHGGVLDRIDGLTSTLPLAALVVPWLLQQA